MILPRWLSAGLFLAVAGCAALPAGSSLCANENGNGDCGMIPTPDGGAGGDGYAVAWDGGIDAATPNATPRGNLCGSTCSPDDARACASDAGLDDAGELSCRVVLGAGQQTSSTCAKAGDGEDGASCTSGADCAPGFECVGTGTCRHYCCHDDACTALTNASQDYSTYFCDVESEHASSGAEVPVCAIVQSCLPLKGQQCGTDQTCTIVEIDNGKNFVATCDAVGDAKLGESCEVAHCAAGFACIGSIGSRKCQQLCDDGHPCSGSATCNVQSPDLAQFNGTLGICSQ